MLSISMIGAGNVATHLAKAFFAEGFVIAEVYSRKIKNAKQLAKNVGAKTITSLNDAGKNVDVIILAVPDDVVDEVAKKISLKKQLLLHTSGSVSLDIIKNIYPNCGVLYPLQSFSKDVEMELDDVPFCLEVNFPEFEKMLIELTGSISNDLRWINSIQREKIHFAAVFANNFTNYLYEIAYRILNDEKIDFDILKPLIRQTAEKLNNSSPLLHQTGPAIRNDNEVIMEHLTLLEKRPEWKNIYQIFTNAIQKSKDNK